MKAKNPADIKKGLGQAAVLLVVFFSTIATLVRGNSLFLMFGITFCMIYLSLLKKMAKLEGTLAKISLVVHILAMAAALVLMIGALFIA